jgi:hypothetical protein
MSSDRLLTRLLNAKNTVDSVTTLSAYVQQAVGHTTAQEVARVFVHAIEKCDAKRIIAILNVINDVLIRTRMTTDAFVIAFGNTLAKTYNIAVSRDKAPQTLAKMQRLCDIWKELGIFSTRFIDSIKSAIENNAFSDAKAFAAPEVAVHSTTSPSHAMQSPRLASSTSNTAALPLSEILRDLQRRHRITASLHQLLQQVRESLLEGSLDADVVPEDEVFQLPSHARSFAKSQRIV